MRSKIAGIGYYVPKNVFTNQDLMTMMDTSDEWIQERTGIKERRYADTLGETTTTMGIEAAKMAIGFTKVPIAPLVPSASRKKSQRHLLWQGSQRLHDGPWKIRGFEPLINLLAILKRKCLAGMAWVNRAFQS